MRAIRQMVVPALALAFAALAVPAEATIWCDDFCCISTCSRTCWTEDGPTTCGAYGSCMGSPSCTGFIANATADFGDSNSPLACTDTGDQSSAAAPAAAQTAETTGEGENL